MSQYNHPKPQYLKFMGRWAHAYNSEMGRWYVTDDYGNSHQLNLDEESAAAYACGAEYYIHSVPHITIHDMPYNHH